MKGQKYQVTPHSSSSRTHFLFHVLVLLWLESEMANSSHWSTTQNFVHAPQNVLWHPGLPGGQGSWSGDLQHQGSKAGRKFSLILHSGCKMLELEGKAPGKTRGHWEERQVLIFVALQQPWNHNKRGGVETGKQEGRTRHNTQTSVPGKKQQHLTGQDAQNREESPNQYFVGPKISILFYCGSHFKKDKAAFRKPCWPGLTSISMLTHI